MAKKSEIQKKESALPVTAKQVRDLMVVIRGKNTLIDSDVAAIYGVETKRVNEAVKNNPEKFPEGYIFETSDDEKKELVENFDRFEMLKHSTSNPKAFTKKALWMIATIIKSPCATSTTISIVEAFDQLDDLKVTMKELESNPPKEKQQHLMQQAGEAIADLIGNDLETSETESEIELNLALIKFKHTIKRKKK